jgi:hypothetical protein
MILVITCIIFTCDNTTEPNEDDTYFQGITETDENGNLIGNFDFDDWALPHRYFGNKIEINPKTSFGATQIGQEVIRYIKFRNHYTKYYTLRFKNISLPYSINRTKISLFPDQIDSLLIKFVLPDTSDLFYRDSLEIMNDSDEMIKFYLTGYWHHFIPINPNDSTITEIEDTQSSIYPSYSFNPAYPNPATDSIAFEYSNISTYKVNLKIIDKNKNIIKILVDNIIQAPGNYRVIWDLKDTEGNVVNPSIYRSELDIKDFHSHGDIMIE